jgi:hypothetical protein
MEDKGVRVHGSHARRVHSLPMRGSLGTARCRVTVISDLPACPETAFRWPPHPAQRRPLRSVTCDLPFLRNFRDGPVASGWGDGARIETSFAARNALVALLEALFGQTGGEAQRRRRACRPAQGLRWANDETGLAAKSLRPSR